MKSRKTLTWNGVLLVLSREASWYVNGSHLWDGVVAKACFTGGLMSGRSACGVGAANHSATTRNTA